MRDGVGRLWFLPGLVPNGREVVSAFLILAFVAVLAVVVFRFLKQWMD